MRHTVDGAKAAMPYRPGSIKCWVTTVASSVVQARQPQPKLMLNATLLANLMWMKVQVHSAAQRTGSEGEESLGRACKVRQGHCSRSKGRLGMLRKLSQLVHHNMLGLRSRYTRINKNVECYKPRNEHSNKFEFRTADCPISRPGKGFLQEV
mmetsp:Transcript_90111/g.197378  ORF Transcript_90111/g.197378 Transcript_90111/m.197378 type:complete len:152 (-) Transcript_90111:162-617(-)